MKFRLIKNSLRRASAIVMGACVALSVASCGGGGGSPGTVSGSSGSTSTDVGSVSLIFSSPELKSAGAAGTEVTVTAQVKSASNNAIADVPVTFTADSGALTGVDAATDKNGQAKATLSISGDHTNRTITVTVRAGTSSVNKTTSGTVEVVGTTVNIAGQGTISAGGTGDFTITVKDSANVAVAGVPISFSSQKGNPIAVKSSGGGTATAPKTNSQGQVVLTLTASQSGNDTLSVSSQGASASAAVNVNAAKLSVSILDAGGNAITTANTTVSCSRIAAHYEVSGVPQNGTINLNTSRGKLYSDSACTTALSSSGVSLTNGDAQATYLKSDTAGVATVTASISNGPSAQANLEFIAPLTSSATISIQAEPAIIGTNSGSGQSEKSTLTAIVRDGTVYNNFVKNAVVEFSIVNDGSGGSLSTPSVMTTAANGSASVVFFAGTADTPKDGVTIQARIQGTSTSATTKLTVTKKSLFISAGTGNKIGTPDTSTYQQDYAVFVTDAAGNPVQGVAVTASVVPTAYSKGVHSFDSATKLWQPQIVATCANEDSNKNGILDAGEDFNNNGTLEPGIPATISSSGTTDANGVATISLRYPRDRAVWVTAQVIIRGSVSGTESTYTTSAYRLPASSSDFSDEKTPPPGVISPYGTNACNVAN